MRWASCSSDWERTGCCGAPTACGTDHPKRNSKPSPRSPSPTSSKTNSATPRSRRSRQILGLNAANLFHLDVDATRCALANDPLTTAQTTAAHLRDQQQLPAPSRPNSPDQPTRNAPMARLTSHQLDTPLNPDPARPPSACRSRPWRAGPRQRRVPQKHPKPANHCPRSPARSVPRPIHCRGRYELTNGRTRVLRSWSSTITHTWKSVGLMVLRIALPIQSEPLE